MGICYENGHGVARDLSKAVEYYKKASELGNSVAMCNLGYCYEKGIGVEQDISQAIEFYQKSSALGNSRASKNLAMLKKQ